MPFRELTLDIDYTGRGEDILTGFVLPLLSKSIEYDRVTSFFTTGSLVAISAGLDELWARRGCMRLVLGLHDIPADLAEAAGKCEDPASELIALIRKRIVAGLANISDEIVSDRLSTVAWMIKDGLLSVRVAAPDVLGAGFPGVFHNKVLIFKDEDGDVVAAVGSPNETGAGLGNNFEHLTAFSSWEQERYTEAQVTFFERLWNDDQEGLTVRPLDASFADEILNSLPAKKRFVRRHESEGHHELREFVDLALRMPALAMVSGGHTALYPHQESVFIETLSRWPVRVMLADEVGLGKTFEAGASIRYLVNYLGVKRVIILAPKAVMYQWQAELIEHFGLNAWVYDSGRRSFISSSNEVRVLGAADPVVGESTPRIAIISSQLARGTKKGGHIFSNASLWPELLVVDEVHSARVKPDLSGTERPTLMWRMLNDVVRRVPHILFASATPMQTHWREYHALLELLGLPKEWNDEQNYHRSLQLITRSDVGELSDAALVARLIRSSLLGFRPQDLELNDAERDLADHLTNTDFDTLTSTLRVRTFWAAARTLLVKVHPARFLTMRNTRTALEQIGYSFPQRNLPPFALVVPDEIRLFYQNVEKYLSEAYFEVEKAIFPEKKFSVGFVKCAYQQRLASSLAACRLSLLRRRDRIIRFEKDDTLISEFEREFEELAESEVFNHDAVFEIVSDSVRSPTSRIAARAASIERSFIDDLLQSLDRILGEGPDPKMISTVGLIKDHIETGDKVLVFSRYTDTLDAAICAYREFNQQGVPPYAVYTGQTADVDFGGGLQRSTRKGVRQALDDGIVQVVFCSDAASEGLNLQSARVIINIDVPWNPARLEQRIGRIARLGQRSPSVDIYNLWYPESIEARMYTRLMERRDLFELAVGEFPDVVGSAIRDELAQNYGTNTNNKNPIAELNALKNDLQVQALRKLWDRDLPTMTRTKRFRTELGSLALSAAQHSGATVVENEGVFSIMFDGTSIRFSVIPGRNDVISLKHPALKWLLRQSVTANQPVAVLTNDSGPAFFTLEGKPVDPATFPGLINRLVCGYQTENISEATHLDSDGSRVVSSRWLPSSAALTIPVQLECEPGFPPVFDVDSMIMIPLGLDSVE